MSDCPFCELRQILQERFGDAPDWPTAPEDLGPLDVGADEDSVGPHVEPYRPPLEDLL